MGASVETGRPSEREGAIITVSEKAASEVRRFLVQEGLDEERAGLRVSVVPGGCSGFEYSLEIEEKREEDDIVVDARGLRLYVDPFSVQYLAGIHIDYRSSFQGSGFTFDNPNATGGCGCGSSFAV